VTISGRAPRHTFGTQRDYVCLAIRETCITVRQGIVILTMTHLEGPLHRSLPNMTNMTNVPEAVHCVFALDQLFPRPVSDQLDTQAARKSTGADWGIPQEV
jgi:hypothetical protein